MHSQLLKKLDDHLADIKNNNELDHKHIKQSLDHFFGSFRVEYLGTIIIALILIQVGFTWLIR